MKILKQSVGAKNFYFLSRPYEKIIPNMIAKKYRISLDFNHGMTLIKCSYC